MAALTLAGLTYLGGSIIGWGLGKGYEQTFSVSNAELKRRLSSNKLPAHNDIERAVLTAHYKTLQFIVEHTFSQKADKRVNRQSLKFLHMRSGNGFKQIFKSIDKGEFAGLISDGRGDWQNIIPTQFEQAQELATLHKSLPTEYIERANADLLSLADWSPTEKEALAEWAAHPDLGWAAGFTAYLSQQIKINEPFYKIFSATNQQHQLRALASIEEQLKIHLAPNEALSEAMSRVELFLQEFRAENREAHAKTHDELKQLKDDNAELKILLNQIDQSVKRQHYETEVGHQYPNYLAKLLIKSDVDEGLWEDEITTALTRYVQGKTQLQKQRNLPHHLEAKRAEALALYEQARLDEGEAILRELVKTVTLERLESAARDHAGLLIDQVPFATAKLDFNRALGLYEQAANAIVAIDKRQAINWLWEAGNIARKRGELFGEGFLKQAKALYLSAITHCCDRVGKPSSKHIDQWAAIQNNLANVYQVKGERGEDGALDKAITAYKDALTIRTKDAAPMDWAMTQNNLANVYSVKGHRGEDGALDKAITAYKAALTIYTKDAAPMDWAMTQNNLASAYLVKGQRGEDGALDKAITAYNDALTIRTKDAAPMNWAATMENLGDAHWAKGDKKETEHCYRNALAEYRKLSAVWKVENLEKWMRKRGMEP